MAENKTIAICDAGPIIHLDELESLDLLHDFYPLVISKTVREEVTRHRASTLQHPELSFTIIEVTSPPEPRLSVLSRSLALDKGEIESLSLMRENPAAIFLTDDAAARLVAEEFGYKVHGTIGILLRGIRRNVRTPEDIINLLKKIPMNTTLFLRPALLEEIIQKVKEEHHI